MDSLTQIVLGASMGEVVAGRKIGNKAMLWGAVAGTTPDLDVLGGFFGMSPEDALAFHRAISHSLVFSVIAPLALMVYVQWFYKNEYNKRSSVKWTTAIAGMLFLLFAGSILSYIPYVFTGSVSWIMICLVILGIYYFGRRLYENYVQKEQQAVSMSNVRWYALFFLATITHPLLDCCTGYGTQLFQPFSNIRIAWNNISVVDPIYTGVFLFFLLLAAFTAKNKPIRSIFNYMGIACSMLYLAWTVHNKIKVDNVFEHSLQTQQVEYSRCMTTPTIFNNFLWRCVAESDSIFYEGYYSLNDKIPEVKLQTVNKNHDLIKFKDDKRYKTLTWFSNEYFSILPLESDTLQFNDLRYGGFIGSNPNLSENYIFSFKLIPQENGYQMFQSEGRPPEGRMRNMLSLMWKRMKGLDL